MRTRQCREENYAVKRKTKEPRFIVNVAMKAVDLPKAGAAVTFEIQSSDKRLIGTLSVGQGSLNWKPRHGGSRRTIRVPWNDVTARLMRRRMPDG